MVIMMDTSRNADALYMYMMVCMLCNLPASDELMERVGDVLEDEEKKPVTWSGQFIE
jgi:hypothetical protein